MKKVAEFGGAEGRDQSFDVRGSSCVVSHDERRTAQRRSVVDDMALNLLIARTAGGRGEKARRRERFRGRAPRGSRGSRPATSLREAVHAKTDIGLRAKAIMDRGELVSDDVMNRESCGERLGGAGRCHRRAFVLDGFPRDGVAAGLGARRDHEAGAMR